MEIVKPPQKLDFDKRAVFLAGSIEMGKAIDWQAQMQELLKDVDVAVLNPRRDDWDNTWENKITNPQFKEQVTWELNGLNKASVIFMYLAPETVSPISLLELGLYAEKAKMVLCCPEGFSRKGNVDIVAERYDITVVKDLEEGAAVIKEILVLLDHTKWG